ncbi:PqqD family peptide modification chaperone [Paenibacillus sp. HJL G12]|uniref:PqqD family peptide modification chaperone n=1 Tax=Paenibacillus dendrobii TaxID=2691084 RepID=A0A7X3IGE2_9BACL|nr:PqqD family protein [Paenibacillus dendrobii]MWV43452.1 PqqD family peptide modification chaperone [Paenibacillus dendrobii]
MIGFKSKKNKVAAESPNLLDMVPVLTNRIASVQTNEEKVTLLLPRRSWLERQSVKWLKQPSTIQIHLDDLGSAVVIRCCGEQSVGEIADGIRERFGESAEPLLPRLSKFMEVLEANGLLTWLPSTENEEGSPAAK